MAVDILDLCGLLSVTKPPCLLPLLCLQNGINAVRSQFYMDCSSKMKILEISIPQPLARSVFSKLFFRLLYDPSSYRPPPLTSPKAFRCALLSLLKSYSVSPFFHHRSPNLQADGVVRGANTQPLLLKQLIQNGNAQYKKCFISQMEKCLRFLATFAFPCCMHDHRVFGKFLPQHH